MNKKLPILIIYSAFLVGTFLPFFAVQATDTTTTLNVGLTIPGGDDDGDNDDGGVNEQPPTDNAPSISNVIATPGTTTVTVTWSASDDKGISSVAFNYGTTLSYGSAGTVGENYQTQISSLQPSTQYYFKISVTDSVGHITEHTSTFTTQSAADTTAPSISAITVAAGVTTTTIQWSVNELATGQISYGLTPSYGLSALSDNGSSLTHTISLSSLLSNTTYHYRLTATDALGNSSSTIDATFLTSQDITPPANPGNVTAATTTDSIVLSWTNPLDSDFSGVTIVRKTGSAPTNRTDGTTVYTGSEQGFTDGTVSGNVTYYYSLFSFDTSNNYSSGASVGGRVTVFVVNEICGNTIDDDRNGQADCADNVCSAYPACQPKLEICNNSIDDDTNGLTDCSDPVCSGANYCAVTNEVCNNGFDDDSNGKTDCDDVACFAFSSCKTIIPNDYQPPTSTISDFARITLADVQFLGAGRTVVLQQSNGKVTSLAGTTLTTGIKKSKLAGTPSSVVLVVDGSDRYQMALNEGDQTYYTDSIFPRAGLHMSGIEVDYGSGIRDNVSFTLEGLSYGTVKAGDNPLDGATIVLLYSNGKAIPNTTPIMTVNGLYGIVVPNGSYSLKVTKQGFYDRVSPTIVVATNVINTDFSLIEQPPDILEVISATSTLAQNVGNIAKNISAKTKAAAELGVQKLKDTAAVVQEFTENPVVQEQASQVVAPTAVTVTAVGTIAIASWGNLIPFLRLFFLQPLMLLGLRRRKGWGQVYNTLSKMPVDLATLRLLNADTGKVIQSKVTDKEGRYAFVVNPGKYTIQVVKNGFAFPSLLLGNAKNDGRRTDIYHGEIIEVTANDAVITANIPLDPAGEYKRPARIFWQRLGRTLQVALSWFGLVITVVSLYISPLWYVWVLFGVHILFFVVFHRLAIPNKIKSWGIAYDSTSKKPIGRVVARLFNSEFNKMVATQITDSSGRYYFLASDDKYYVTYDHPEYAPEKTNVLDLGGKEAENIAVDIGLTKGGKTALPATPAPVTPAAVPAQVVTTSSASSGALPTTHIDLNNPPEPSSGA